VTNKKSYKLGEEINNGVKYFGQEKRLQNGAMTAMCVCPVCGELWRATLKFVRNGSSKQCCGKVGRKRISAE